MTTALSTWTGFALTPPTAGWPAHGGRQCIAERAEKLSRQLTHMVPSSPSNCLMLEPMSSGIVWMCSCASSMAFTCHESVELHLKKGSSNGQY